MLPSNDFFKTIFEHYEASLPFVAYSKPNMFEIQALLQKDDNLYKVENFEESGFVFSPFDIRKDTILIPSSRSRQLLTADDVVLDVQTPIDYTTVNDKEHHLHLVDKAIRTVKEGNLKKVVISRKELLKFSGDVDIMHVFKSLLHHYNSAFVYCWYHPKVGLWMGATPETLLSVDRNRFSTMALAGTQNYEGSLEVSWSKKEIEEQQLVTEHIVDQLKEDLDTLQIAPVKTVKAGRLLHLRTDISGELTHALKSLPKLILKMHPTPAVCGTPKLEAMQFILDNEHYNREFYTGFLGELNKETKMQPRSGRRNIENRAYAFNKRSTHLFVNLRCMQIQNKEAIIYVGGGITKDSIAENEWLETVNKSQTMKHIFAF